MRDISDGSLLVGYNDFCSRGGHLKFLPFKGFNMNHAMFSLHHT